ncbi:MAG: ParB N-terminal domain-containing protein [Cyanobacteria bacterium REEB65]|nr:ParB N-terminal domain-containing protein [Cyanobacteria bacterium REEB65]
MSDGPWRNRIVGHGTEDPEQLLANPKNWRRHPGEQRDALRGSLATVGWVAEVTVNTTTGHVVDGHARIEEAISRGEKVVPVRYVELTTDEEAIVLASLDPIGGLATRDEQLLADLLADVRPIIDDAGLQALLDGLDGSGKGVGLTDPDDIPEPPGDAVTSPGDIWLLGPHRLICGDSTDGEAVRQLLQGDLATMVLADPPYNVNYRGGSSAKTQVRADAYPDQFDDYRGFLTDVLRVGFEYSHPRAALHLWHSCNRLRDVLGAMDATRWSDRSYIVWDKGSIKGGLSQTSKQYRTRFEPMIYGFKKGQTPFWYGPGNESDLWEVPGPTANPLHPTMKPVALYERSIENHTQPGELVLELFGGSGTALIAAHVKSRRSALVEKEPRFCDVIARRFQEHIGELPVLKATGEPHDFTI